MWGGGGVVLRAVGFRRDISHGLYAVLPQEEQRSSEACLRTALSRGNPKHCTVKGAYRGRRALCCMSLEILEIPGAGVSGGSQG